MFILGIPDGVDPKTVRPRSDWPFSARCMREHRRRDEMRANARAAFDCLTDRELTVKVMIELTEDVQGLGEDDPPPGFPNAATMSRDEMLDYLADSAVAWLVPDIELVYPDAIDPTA